MTTTPLYTVWCDFEGCPAWSEASVAGGNLTASQARQAAKRTGWKVGVPAKEFPPPLGRSRRDYCPQHAKEMTGG